MIINKLNYFIVTSITFDEVLFNYKNWNFNYIILVELHIISVTIVQVLHNFRLQKH